MEAAGVNDKSWVEYTTDSHFPVQNIPYGVFANPTTGKDACCTRVGDYIFDLSGFEASGILTTSQGKFASSTLNDFMELGKEAWSTTRTRLQEIFSKDSADKAEAEKHGVKVEEVPAMRMPVFIRDYTDFYSSKNHAYNVGVMFRGPDNALQPNWLHLPVGYHGRASSVVLTGTDITRPMGQTSADKKTPSWGQCKRLDFELEVGAYVGTGNKLGEPIKIENAADHLFGLCILNDWSARDLQVWEYVPLGPFNAKNFASTISPWVVTMDALAPFKTPLPK